MYGRRTQVHSQKQRGGFREFPTTDPAYKVQQTTRAEDVLLFDRIVGQITPAQGFSLSLVAPVDAPNPILLALTTTSTNLIHAACLIVEKPGSTVREIYAYTKHRDLPKGKGSLLLKTLIDYIRTNKIQITIWVGVQIITDNSHLSLINKIYRPLGFYFPGVFPSYSVGETITPHNRKFPFEFFSGYWSAELEKAFPFISHSTELTVSYTDTGVNKIRTTFFQAPYEIAGLFTLQNKNTLQILTEHIGGINSESVCNTTFLSTKDLKGVVYDFHTHPYVCHEITKLYLGFPSFTDYVATAQRLLARVSDGGFVFSAEGLFFIQFHPLLNAIIRNGQVNEISKAIEQNTPIIREYLEYMERSRQIPDDILRSVPNLKEFVLQRIQELFYNISQITINVGDIRVPIFYLQYQFGHTGNQIFYASENSIRSE
jgi:hypothetical protein